MLLNETFPTIKAYDNFQKVAIELQSKILFWSWNFVKHMRADYVNKWLDWLKQVLSYIVLVIQIIEDPFLKEKIETDRCSEWEEMKGWKTKICQAITPENDSIPLKWNQ